MFVKVQIYLHIFLNFNFMNCDSGILSDYTAVSWNILPQFPNYMLIIHYDNSSYFDVDVFFSKTLVGDARFKSLINYDTAKDIRRPLGYKFLNLVFLRRWSEFKRFSGIEKNIKYDDVVVFITETYTPGLNKYFHYSGLEQANVIFVYATNDDVVYTARFYNTKSGVLRQVVKDVDGVPQLDAYLNDFKNFDNFQLTVAFSNCEPYIYKEYNGDGFMVKGAEFVVLNLIADMLNFKVELVDYSNRTLPRTSMIEAVRDKLAHLAIGCISNTVSRNEMVDFTSNIKMETHIAIFSSSGYQDNSFFKIFKPFEAEVWIYLIVTVVLMGLLIKKMSDFIVGFQDVDLLDYIKVPFRNMLEQPVEMPSNKAALRLVCLSWFLVAMIITNSYKSKLASSLIKPAMNEPEDLEALVVNNFAFQIPSNDPSYLKETLANSNDKIFKTVLTRWHTDLAICEAIRKTLTGRYAVIDEKTTIKYMFWNECTKILTPLEVSTMRLIKRSMFQNSHVWALQKAAPFSRRFTMALEILQSFGIVHKWYLSFNLTRSIPYSNQDLSYEPQVPLDLETVFAPFIMLVGGIILSTTAFLTELIYFKYRYNGIDYML